MANDSSPQTLKVTPASTSPGGITVPGDKSISHRAMMLAGVARGTSRVTGFLPSEDCLATVGAMRFLGAGIRFEEDNPGSANITGTAWKLCQPKAAIDCGNSGTTIRLLSGILAAQPLEVTLGGDASLSDRPMGRIAIPLEKMGATVSGQGERCQPPLTIRGKRLESIVYSLPVASAQVKSAVLFAGLQTEGETTVIEPAVTRDHTERMVRAYGGNVECDGRRISVNGPQELTGTDFHVPGDISSAAFWLVAAAAMPGAKLVLKQVGLNPTRTGVLDVLSRMGARITVANQADQVEPYGDILVEGGGLHATTIGGDEIPNVIDELPVLAVAAALAEGETVIRDAAELRVKESDRISAVVKNLEAVGAHVTEQEDGMKIRGGGEIEGGTVESYGDHRIAMSFAILGLFSQKGVAVRNSGCIATSYPGFAAVLKRWQARSDL